MIELGLLALTIAAGAKITLSIIGGIFGLFALFILGCKIWGWGFLEFLVSSSIFIFWLAVAFAVIFLAVMGIGALI